MASQGLTSSVTPPCCVVDTEKCAIAAGGIQIVCGILWLCYSIVVWLTEPFPRVKSEFETYYAFGQPLVSGFLGVGLLICINASASTDFLSKFIYGGCWLAIQATLVCLTVFRITSFFMNPVYTEIYGNEQNYLMAECFAVGTRTIIQLYEVIAVISYLCDQMRITDDEDVGWEGDTDSLSVQVFWSVKRDQVMIQQKQLILLSEPFIPSASPPVPVPIPGPGSGPTMRNPMYTYPYHSPYIGQLPTYYRTADRINFD